MGGGFIMILHFRKLNIESTKASKSPFEFSIFPMTLVSSTV